jgi:hypothetical protein
VAHAPAVHYSVDVVFRFLPDLARFARSAADNDLLLERPRSAAAGHRRAWRPRTEYCPAVSCTALFRVL